MQNALSAGFSAVDITPPRGHELAGYPHFPRHNTGAHDPLTASCLYLHDGETAVAVVGLDTLFFSKKHVEVVRGRVADQTGIPRGNILFCCSHSHSTPWAAGRLDMDSLLEGVQQDAGYINELYDKLSALIVSASRTAFACEIGFGAQRCGREQNIGGNRRDPVNGPCDPHAYVLAVRDLAGTVRGTLVSYAVHPTLLHADNTLCSADYPGYLRACLREAFPQGTMVFALGASGDQSSRYFRSGQTFAEAERFGYTIGAAVKQAVEGMTFARDLRLSAASATVPLNLRALPDKAAAERHVREKKEVYDRLVAEKAPYIEVQNANVALLGAEDILGYVLMREQGLKLELVEDELPAEVSLLRVGDIFLAGLPGEVFMGISQLIRERAGVEKLIVSTVTNGCLPGYVYTREDAALGGYEVDTSMLDENAGYAMADALLELFPQR